MLNIITNFVSSNFWSLTLIAVGMWVLFTALEKIFSKRNLKRVEEAMAKEKEEAQNTEGDQVV